MWITGAPYMVLKMMHLSGCMGIKTMPIMVAPQRFMGYKYFFHLASLAIQNISTFLLGFFSSHLHLLTMENKRQEGN
jgi:hypothetical protein